MARNTRQKVITLTWRKIMKTLKDLLASVESHSLLVTIKVDADKLPKGSFDKSVLNNVIHTFTEAEMFANLFKVDLKIAAKFPTHSKDAGSEVSHTELYLLIPSVHLHIHNGINPAFELFKKLLHNGGSVLPRIAVITYEAVTPTASYENIPAFIETSVEKNND